MKKYQLCYETFDSKIIMPIKLAVSTSYEPVQHNDSIYIYYDYVDFIDEMILHKLIVRLHQYIYNNIVWRRGVVLKFKAPDNVMAEIIMQEISRKIEIKVWATEDYANRRSVMDHIRREIDQINLEYYKREDDSLFRCMIPILDNDGEIINWEGKKYKDLINHLKNGDEYYINSDPYLKVKIRKLLGYIEPEGTTAMNIKKEDRKKVRNKYDYDAFISHASEDKEEIADDLAIALSKRGIKIWYDKFSLAWGDSLMEKISEGITNSKFGILILSHNFFSKQWTGKEMEALFDREFMGGKVILPLWHNISKSDVAKYSPLIAGKLALKTSDLTIEEICDKLEEQLKNTQENEAE
jgi:hypothetical protein